MDTTNEGGRHPRCVPEVGRKAVLQANSGAGDLRGRGFLCKKTWKNHGELTHRNQFDGDFQREKAFFEYRIYMIYIYICEYIYRVA